MSETFKQKTPRRKLKSIRKDSPPIQVFWSEGKNPPIIEFANGDKSVGSCIHCNNPPCMEYTDKELQLKLFREFPFDRNDMICPTKAIFWPHDADCPQIDEGLCIYCGICISRCPAFAMYIDDAGAHINDDVNKYFMHATEGTHEDNFADVVELFSDVKESGFILSESDDLFKKIYKRIESLIPSLDAQFPNHLARNLLCAIDLKTAMRRRGDTNLRMDLMFEQNNIGGTGEVEFSTITLLDSPRDILDDVAILIARYEFNKKSIIPLIVSLGLPNQRSEYWQVIEDIARVLDVKISSITIGILMMMVWSRHKFLVKSDDDLFVIPGTYSLRQNVEKNLNRKINVTNGFLGIIESSK